MFIRSLFSKAIFNNSSIGRYFAFFAGLVISIIISVYIFISYQNYRSKLLSTLNRQSYLIEGLFNDTINNSYYLTSCLNSEIHNINPHNAYNISALLSHFKKISAPWDTISWLDTNLKIIANSDRRIIKPISVADREYIELGNLNFDKIRLGKVVYGRISNELIMPAIIDVKNKQKKHIGSIIFSFATNKLIKKIENLIDADGIEFAFFDKELDIALKSKNFVIDPALFNKIKSLSETSQIQGKIIDFNLLNSWTFVPAIYKKIEKYPYLIVVHYNYEFFKNSILLNLLFYISKILILLLGLGLFFHLIKKILITPIINLSLTAEAISKDDDKNLVFPHSNIKEINTLIHKIELIHNYKEKLKEADKSQKAFFTNMNHELRTPLNGILSFIKMLKAEIYGPISNEGKEALELMLISAQNLLNLLNDLLDYSKIDAGKMNLEETEFNLHPEVNIVIESLSSLAASNDVKIIYIADYKFDKIFADQKMFKQILSNILSNAIKFSNSSSKVEMNSKINQEGDIEILVKDYGVGITKEDMAKISNEYNIINDGYFRTKHQGTGIGLALANKMAKLHQGKLIINSEPLKGTQVKFILPKARICK
jgi:signal transduction histidine kinase